MKKQFFTFLMMIALVIVAGKAMAQSTATAPYEGATHTYTWTATSGATHTIFITASTVTDPNTALTSKVAEGTDFDFGVSGGTLTQVSGNSTTITWAVGSAGTTYHVWIQVSDGTCSNFEYVPVTPVVNNLAFQIYALGKDDNNWNNGTTALADIDNQNSGEDCSTIGSVGSNYLSGSRNEGTTVVYYVVERTGGNSSRAWSFNLALANANLTATTVSSGTLNSGTGAVTAVPATDNRVLVTVTHTNVTTSDTAIAATLSNTNETGTGSGTITAPATVTYTISALPAVGTFSGN